MVNPPLTPRRFLSALVRGWIADGRSMDPGANVQSLATGEVRSGEEYQTKFQICMYVLYMYHGAVLIKIEKNPKFP